MQRTLLTRLTTIPLAISMQTSRKIAVIILAIYTGFAPMVGHAAELRAHPVTNPAATGPIKLTNEEMDQITAGFPFLIVGILLLLGASTTALIGFADLAEHSPGPLAGVKPGITETPF